MSKEGSRAFVRVARDGSTSGGLLFKASNSLKRSPSKRNRDPASNSLAPLEQVFYDAEKVAAADIQPVTKNGPDMYRIQTMPLESVSSTPAVREGKRSQSIAEGSRPATHHRKELLNTNAGGLLTGNEYANHPAAAPAAPPSTSGSGSQNPNVVYQHIHDMASKRISTLDYFRKAHEGRVFWFNTVHFSHQDLSRIPSCSASKLSRRATNYLLLGLSIPPVLDGHPQTNSAASTAANATAAYDFLRTLNTLLGEFETYQQIHPPDGSTQSALSRARIPHMIKRATHATTGRARRTSSNTSSEIGLPIRQTAPYTSDQTNHYYQHHPQASQSSIGNALESNMNTNGGSNNNNNNNNHNGDRNDSYNNKHNHNSSTTNLSISAPTLSGASSSAAIPTASSHFLSFPSAPTPSQAELPNSTIFPSEAPYTCLLTPPLPFAPDFYTVFANLCDVLIDAYQRIVALVNSPAVCSHGVLHPATHSLADMFAKADARLRKVIVGGIVRDFEAATRDAGKKEVAGVGRVVLGGLMGA